MSREIYRPQKQETEISFSEAEMEKWKSGANKYKLFAKKIAGISDFPRQGVGEVQALFLGEKPAVFKNSFALANKEALESNGFKFFGDYCYHPQLVMEVIEKNRDVFTSFSEKNPETVMQELMKAPLNELSEARGIILGIPRTAAKAYKEVSQGEVNRIIEDLIKLLPDKEAEYLRINYMEKDMRGNHELLEFIIRKLETGTHRYKLHMTNRSDREKLKERLRKIINSRGVDIYGAHWIDYGPSRESEEKKIRLKAAFENSGILSY